MNSLQIKFLVLIAVVFLATVGFAILIWQQTITIEKKALAAKRRQQSYKDQQKDTDEK